MTFFVVIRHGETHWNIEKRIQGQHDSPLTEAGRRQAQALGERLARDRFDLMVSSDLGRAMETARLVGEATGLEPLADARLRERGFGAGEGLLYAEVEERYPGAFRFGPGSDPDFAIPGGESRRQFHERVAAAFEALALEHPGRRVVVVAHGGVLGALYRHVHGIPVAHAHRIAIANASYNALTFELGAWTVHAWADDSHLAEGSGSEET